MSLVLAHRSESLELGYSTPHLLVLLLYHGYLGFPGPYLVILLVNPFQGCCLGWGYFYPEYHVLVTSTVNAPYQATLLGMHEMVFPFLGLVLVNSVEVIF